MKIVINGCFGGFGLSPFAVREYLRRKGKKCFQYVQTKYGFRDGKEKYERYIKQDLSLGLFYTYLKDKGGFFTIPSDDDYFSSCEINRDDVDLVAVVENFGTKKVSSRFGELKVVEIPDGTKWFIDEYDGLEHIAEEH